MDTRRLLTMMMLCFAIIFGWQIFVDRVLAPKYNWKRTGQATTAPTPAPATPPAPTTTTTASATTGQTSQPSVPQVSATAPSMSTAALRVISPATQPSVVTIGDKTAHEMIVNLSSQGAGLDSVTL